MLIGLRSSSVSGWLTLGTGVMYSLTHCLGYSPDRFMELKMCAAIGANSSWNSLLILGGISPGTEHVFNFRDLNVLMTSSEDRQGVSMTSAVLILYKTLLGRDFKSIGSYSWLMALKWRAICSADSADDSFCCMCDWMLNAAFGSSPGRAPICLSRR